MSLNSAGILLIMLIFSFLAVTGCTTSPQVTEKPSYHIGQDGSLTFTLPPVTATEDIISEKDGIITEKITFHTHSGDVNAILAGPKNPRAAVVYAPGAGVPASGHRDRAYFFAAHSIAFLIIDVRGNGGETPGHPFDLKTDIRAYLDGEWPQTYLIITDMIQGKDYLRGLYGNIPIWAAGSSNGGRYAVIAAAAEPDFAGCIGISTAGFGFSNLSVNEPVRQYLNSIEPEIAVTTLAPRPVIIFHAPPDPIIPYAAGLSFAERAGNNTPCIPFNGTHGITGEVDEQILSLI
ncbi:MAG: alpha/beta hydrolase [Methanospirillaceae archaeon]|nr:alpha/beta hydrolase [Methanospirillaceae archaeon]